MMPNKAIQTIIPILLMACCGCSPKADHEKFNVARVAHAGGALNGETYTNSIEALDENLLSGFVYFEIDLLFTSDGHLVCGHSWNDDTGHIDWQGIAPTHEHFKERTQKELDFTRCTLTSLMLWLKQNPSAYLITDIKGNNVDGLIRIATAYPELLHRVIPQIYLPEEFTVARELGYGPIIWILYRIRRPTTKYILEATEHFTGPFALAFDSRWVNPERTAPLHARKIPLYLYTLNSDELAFIYVNKGYFSEVYTDDLAPPTSKIVKWLCRKVTRWDIYKQFCIGGRPKI